MKYQLTPLENDIKNLYLTMGIYRPDQIDLEDIAFKLDIWLHEAKFKSRARSYKGMHTIVIDSRISEPEKWEHFGHEVNHILYHEGNQLNMPSSFRQFQEAKSNNFALHFCIPTFMILDSGLPYTWNEATLYVMETFNVTEPFARKRLLHFNNQVIGFEFYEALRREWSLSENNFKTNYTTTNKDYATSLFRKEYYNGEFQKNWER
ncbi:ImmA/IrrE family metallo-endopeptidase [Cytobacillus firmus]|uniref:ImmA/IrrE family metallo-endopeptidase n=1 Tax=Cytobacillus firmus TaxID=1399 RepID=UPI00237A3675|nr:ImmA/IrrE family metallo-endopeptidase [Cytobacillus firmus]MDD9312695.1 ImmA/IrrE family metallo-endopeptidase [Cytobacillus firmus]